MKKLVKLSRKICMIAVIAILSMTLIAMPAFAANAPLEDLEVIENFENLDEENSFNYTSADTGRAVGGFGTFTINTSGNGGPIYDRIAITSYNTKESPIIYISIIKPDGSYFKNSFFLEPNSTKEFSMFFSQSGTYTIEYNISLGYSYLKAEINRWFNQAN